MDQLRMSMCRILAARSTCWKKKTAAIIIHDNRIVSEGWNGTLGGELHCEEIGPRDRAAHREWSDCNEIHAEMKAILSAANHRGVPRGATMYTILSPCVKCAQAIVLVGIERVVYQEVYRENGLDYLRNHDVELHKYLGSTHASKVND